MSALHANRTAQALCESLAITSRIALASRLGSSAALIATWIGMRAQARVRARIGEPAWIRPWTLDPGPWTLDPGSPPTSLPETASHRWCRVRCLGEGEGEGEGVWLRGVGESEGKGVGVGEGEGCGCG